MALITCEQCGTKQDVSVFEQDATCQECGADGGALTPVSATESASRADPVTVLLADDDPDFRETLRLTLQEHDGPWAVHEVADGREALEALDDGVDVLVLDRDMPHVTGSEVVDRLDETAFDGEILVVSAYEADSRLREVDVEGYLTKPVPQETFLAMLEQVVEG